VSKIILAHHLGARSKADAYHFLHDLRLRLAETCVPAMTTDGLRAYFYAITAHFGQWVAGHWVVHPKLVYGQLVKRRERNPAMAAGLTDHLWKVGDILRLPLIFEPGGVC
jgi:hypothetical protein